jgi:hypothetical protein
MLGLPAWSGPEGWGVFSLAIVDQMLRDYQVSQAIAFKEAPLHTAEFDIEANSEEVKSFAEMTLQRYWQKSLHYGLDCMSYGYGASEVLYRIEGGPNDLEFDCLKPLHPRDVKPYTVQGKLAYVKVVSSMSANTNDSLISDLRTNPDKEAKERDESGAILLNAATKNVPAKGFWTTFEPRYNPWFGRPLVLPSWWPWRLKVMPDGAFESIAKAYYKFGFGGMIGRYPNQEYQDSTMGAPVHAQDYMRQIAEQAKAGADIMMSSERDEKGQYLFNWEKYGGDVKGDFSQLLAYPDWLDRLIVRGMRIPDELLLHPEVGSYSRANAVWLSFLTMEEQILNHHLETFEDQILKPLIRLRFGPQAKYEIKPRPLMPDPQQMQQQVPGLGGDEEQGGMPEQQGARQPYQGPRGGRGWKDASGGVHYGEMSLGRANRLAELTEEFLRRRSGNAA